MDGEKPGIVRVFCDVETWGSGFFSYGWRTYIGEECERIGLFVDENLPYGWKVFMHGTPAMVRDFLSPFPDQVELITGGESWRTALMLAACINLDPEVVEVIIERGADVNAEDSCGMTPLMHAAGLNPNPEVAGALIRAGANVNAKDHDGMTPLMFAADHADEFSCVQQLIDEGADVNARSEDGRSALMFAAETASSQVAAEDLLAAGADIEAQNAEGETSLMVAVRNKSLDAQMFHFFHAEGANVHAADCEGTTPLMLALGWAGNGLCHWSYLIGEGVEVNGRNNSGWSPLLFAARHCADSSVIPALLAAGANPRFIVQGEGNVLDLAKMNKNLVGTEEYLELEEAFFAQEAGPEEK